MNSIESILNFTLSSTDFYSADQLIFSKNLNQFLETHINRLNIISDKFRGLTGRQNRVVKSIPDIYEKFKELFNSSDFNNSFSKKELRTLSFALNYSTSNSSSIYSNPKELQECFRLFEFNWRDNLLYGLIECYLKNWTAEYSESFLILSKFILKKLENYNGTRNAILSFKINKNYFNPENGDKLFGSYLAHEGLEIIKANKILGLPDNWISLPYFANVIISYYENRKGELDLIIDDLVIVAKIQQDETAKFILVTKLIKQADNGDFNFIQDRVKNVALNLIGDPSQTYRWTCSFLSATDKYELDEARNILNGWIIRNFVTVFFERCIYDIRRKNFWLKYARFISEFKVVGSSYTQKILKNDLRISEFVNEHRLVVTSSKTNKNAALMFIIKDYLFVEFSHEGAFYAYKLAYKGAPSIREKLITSTDSLKRTSMSFLVYIKGATITKMNEEGKFRHADYPERLWEDAATYWLKNQARINA